MADVTISYTIGDVSLARGGKKTRIEAVPFKKSVKLKDGDRIITGAASYAVDITDQPGPRENGTWMSIFPNSEVILGIKGSVITRLKLIIGLFKISTGRNDYIVTPTAELRNAGSFWVDVSKDGAVVVASEAAPMEVVHKKTKKGVVINPKQQITVAQEDILEPCGVDQRFKEAHKLVETLEQSKAKFLYGDMLERNVPQELQKFAKVIEDKTGRKEDYDPAKYQKWLKEQKELGEWKFDEAVESKLPDFKPVKVEDKAAPIRKPKIIDINKSANYQGIDFRITSLEKGQEFKGRSAPEGKEFLVLNVVAKNKSAKQVILFYDEEVRLINESGETISLENYKMENNFDPQFETKGFLSFLVVKEDNKSKLQFGKMCMPKVELAIDLSQKEGSN
jgi:hypothetical protein